MPRKKRLWIPESFYHVVCRGNWRDSLFKEDGDFNVFLRILYQIHEKTPFDLASYCLMTNHFHLQLRSKEQPLSKVMSLINKRYANYYNTKNGVSGHLFEKRYYAQIIYSDLDMLKVSKYIHLNPLKAGMVRKPESYQWSSYRYLLNTKNHHLLNMNAILDCFPGHEMKKREMYRDFINEEEHNA